ncbi:hypothetical protein PABG_07057 [Paracoccidioides brasiliensis Pb03]|nr:hypothetical protein PABG_07057 [Paracoccidioides brasiliensis Pb03]
MLDSLSMAYMQIREEYVRPSSSQTRPTNSPQTRNLYGTCETNQHNPRGIRWARNMGYVTLPRMPSIESGSQSVAPQQFELEKRRSNAQNSQNPLVDTQHRGMQQVNAPGAGVTQYAWDVGMQQFDTPVADATQYSTSQWSLAPAPGR